MLNWQSSMNDIDSFFDNFQLPDIQRRRESEADFLYDLIHVANATRWLVFLCASLLPKSTIKDNQQAILTGLMVKDSLMYTFEFEF